MVSKCTSSASLLVRTLMEANEQVGIAKCEMESGMSSQQLQNASRANRLGLNAKAY